MRQLSAPREGLQRGGAGRPGVAPGPTTVTVRLYYTDPSLTEFDADIVAVEQIDGRTGLVLDRTAFYPTSGGQPFDTGTLGGARVVDVVDRDDHTVLHVVEGPLPDGPVHGRIDWDRRVDPIQQHTGQHPLFAALEPVCR